MLLCKNRNANYVVAMHHTMRSIVGRPEPRIFVIATMCYFERILVRCYHRGLCFISAL